MVRQLAPGPSGLPLEIYAFTKTTDWTTYEDIQAEIVNHLLAALPYFGLRLFQQPTGSDLHALKGGTQNRSTLSLLLIALLRPA